MTTAARQSEPDLAAGAGARRGQRGPRSGGAASPASSTRAGSPGARVAGSLALSGLLAAMALLALTTAAGPSVSVPKSFSSHFPGWLAGPLAGLGPRASIPVLEILLVAICACYVVVLCCCSALPTGRVWLTIVAAHVVAALAPPLFSADVFGYIGFARLDVLHGLSPYAFAANAAPHDGVLALVGWPTLTTPYGPLFTLLSDALVPLGITADLWAFKAFAALASLATVALIWRAAPRLGRSPGAAIAFYGLNPLLLVFAVPGAHNETLMGMLIAAGAVGVLAGNDVRGGLALAGATAIKASAALVLPFAVLGARSRRRAAIAIAGGLALVALVGLAAFGPHLFSIGGAVLTQQGKIAGHSVPSQVSQLLGLGRLAPGVRVAFVALFAAVTLAALWRTWRGARWLDGYGASTLALLAATAWLLPWYGLWALLPGALSPSRRLRMATLVACGYLILVQIAVKRPLSAG